MARGTDRPASATDYADQLASAVEIDAVTGHLQRLQDIADANGGNRATGAPGFDESVEFVSEALRAKGFDVTAPEFDMEVFREKSSSLTVAGTPVEKAQVAAYSALYLNFDMLGSPNTCYFTSDADQSSPPDPDMETPEDGPLDGRGDFDSFTRAGIPIGNLDTGADEEKTREQVDAWGGGRVLDGAVRAGPVRAPRRPRARGPDSARSRRMRA